jgi:hypothetical protein
MSIVLGRGRKRERLYDRSGEISGVAPKIGGLSATKLAISCRASMSPNTSAASSKATIVGKFADTPHSLSFTCGPWHSLASRVA